MSRNAKTPTSRFARAKSNEKNISDGRQRRLCRHSRCPRYIALFPIAIYIFAMGICRSRLPAAVTAPRVLPRIYAIHTSAMSLTSHYRRSDIIVTRVADAPNGAGRLIDRREVETSSTFLNIHAAFLRPLATRREAKVPFRVGQGPFCRLFTGHRRAVSRDLPPRRAISPAVCSTLRHPISCVRDESGINETLQTPLSRVLTLYFAYVGK